LFIVVGVLIDWTGEFDRWYDRLIERANAGDARALGAWVRIRFPDFGQKTAALRSPLAD